MLRAAGAEEDREALVEADLAGPRYIYIYIYIYAHIYIYIYIVRYNVL